VVIALAICRAGDRQYHLTPARPAKPWRLNAFKPVVLALAQALIDHPERTLNAAEIDAVISQTLARETLAAEQARRAGWRRTIENVTRFTAFDSAVPR
jgi:hypothetical protein